MYGELSFDEEEAVHQHLETCAACQSEFDKTKAIHHAFDDAEVQVPAELLQNCRRNLRMAVASTSGTSQNSTTSFFARWKEMVAIPWAAVWKPVAALSLVAVGFVGGQIAPTQTRIAGEAEPVISRVRYVQPDDTGNVRLVVDEVRQRVLSGSPEEGQIRNLLLTAAREASDPGVRVETMDLLKSQSESDEVRRALLNALQTDANPGVRLKALDALRSSAQQDETRRVLAQVLLTDDNPGIRTQAIDMLVQRRERDMVGVLQEVMSREDNNYVRLKCQKALHEMNASAETF
jgi:hypothetical protein